MWVRVLFGSLRGRVRFGSVSYTFFLIFGLVFGSVLGKTWVLVGFVLTGLGFFPMSSSSLSTCKLTHCVVGESA